MLRWVRRPLAALLAVSAGVCACGGGPSDSEQVHTAVEAFGRATAAKDYQRLCDELLAPKLVSEVEATGLPCEVALRQGLGRGGGADPDDRADHGSGDAATAEVQSAAAGRSRPRTRCRSCGDDSWRIASLQ